MSEKAERARISVGKKLLFSGVMVGIALVGAELVVRITGAGVGCSITYSNRFRICDPILYFRNSPELRIHGSKVNSGGFRTREFAPKSPDKFRILSLGDSCTIGVFGNKHGIGYVREPYPQKLERLIADRLGPDAAEVFNVGVGGYNSFQGLMLMRTELRKLAPDLVTVRYGWNDHFMSAIARNERVFREPDNRIALALQGMLLRTHLYPFFRRSAIDARAKSVSEAEAVLPSEWVPNVSLDQYKRNLGRIAEVAHSRGSEVWFVTAPHAFIADEYRGKYDAYASNPRARKTLGFNGLKSFERFVKIHEAYAEATREAGIEFGVTVVDMVPAYEARSYEHLFSSLDAMHPLQIGHDIEAAILLDRLLESGLME